jgi:hypothetical protein
MQAQRRMTYFDGVRHDCCSRDTNYNIDLPICYQQAAQHPFLTGEPFDGPFKPQPEIPRTVSALQFSLFCLCILLTFCYISCRDYKDKASAAGKLLFG